MMDYEKGIEIMMNALKGFHGRFKKMYGQAAMRLDDSTYLMTEGNYPLSGISEDGIVVCDINSDGIGEIFRSMKDVNALIVGCSQDTVAVSERKEPLPVTLEDLAHLTGPELMIIPDASPASIIRGLKDSSVCLISGTGALAVGSNLRKAVAGAQIVEKACEAEVHGSLLGGTVTLPTDAAAKCRKDFVTDYVNRNESADVAHVAYMGFDEAEFALRSQLIEYGKDLVRHDLAYGSWGNLSVRINEEEMLITPSSIDYFEIKPEDLVRINISTLDYGSQRIPSTFTGVHAALYREFPDCSAVIHTHSNAMSVFAACRAGFKIKEPDMNALIGDVLVTDPFIPGTPESVATIIETMRETHAAVIPNHGAIFTGPSLEVVCAIAEAVEIRARNLLGFDSRPDDDEQ